LRRGGGKASACGVKGTLLTPALPLPRYTPDSHWAVLHTRTVQR